MPSFPIVDAHVHLWDPQIFRIPWLAGDLMLEQRYGVDTFNQHSQPQAVEAFVYVEVNVDPVYALIEARHVAAIAATEPRLQAIVAWAPLFHGRQMRLYLDELVAISPLIRGVRQVTQGEADQRYVAQPAFVEAAQLLPRYGLTCDICIKHPQLEAVIELVQRCPETTFMLDHIAKPDIAAGLLDPWRAQIRQLAALPNVWCKISGMVTEADLRHWQPSDLAPYIDQIIDSFGEDRILFGGDWPVVLLASSYQRWLEALEQLTEGLSDTAKQKLWRENAKRFYRLG